MRDFGCLRGHIGGIISHGRILLDGFCRDFWVLLNESDGIVGTKRRQENNGYWRRVIDMLWWSWWSFGQRMQRLWECGVQQLLGVVFWVLLAMSYEHIENRHRRVIIVMVCIVKYHVVCSFAVGIVGFVLCYAIQSFAFSLHKKTGSDGFEPTIMPSESIVLPLHYDPIVLYYSQTFLLFKDKWNTNRLCHWRNSTNITNNHKKGVSWNYFFIF